VIDTYTRDLEPDPKEEKKGDRINKPSLLHEDPILPSKRPFFS